MEQEVSHLSFLIRIYEYMTSNKTLIFFLQGKCCCTDDCNKGEILNAAGHMFQASIFIEIFNAFIATKLMGQGNI